MTMKKRLFREMAVADGAAAAPAPVVSAPSGTGNSVAADAQAGIAESKAASAEREAEDLNNTATGFEAAASVCSVTAACTVEVPVVAAVFAVAGAVCGGVAAGCRTAADDQTADAAKYTNLAADLTATAQKTSGDIQNMQADGSTTPPPDAPASKVEGEETSPVVKAGTTNGASVQTQGNTQGTTAPKTATPAPTVKTSGPKTVAQ